MRMERQHVRILLTIALVLVTTHGQAVVPAITYLRIMNNAAADINDTLVMIENPKEWAGNNPQTNFINVHIDSGCNTTEQEDVNLAEKASHFVMQLFYSDNTMDQFRINQQYVYKGTSDFMQISGNRYITYGSTSNHTVVITIQD